ncbi:hypothetical protein CORC01_01285 [Colletotrichum orchidophilum]|uniref:Uncharacterized protein n=1 Tax=Colletotrichum orchidophilum TaxID=1209926 RepID=A0A1G4BQJ7_9PEZI|nr:uncharacterized protein CORC01_01285 [Colletotrichum orchidophilum]OHF03566.1 hypothetical protein CORC01_01285 [Colletotrichum orchidophilum]
MCIQKFTWHQCPETERGRHFRQTCPADQIIKDSEGAFAEARVWHSTHSVIVDQPLRPGMEFHGHESMVYCAHPYHGHCRDDAVCQVTQVAEGECPWCLGDNAFPRRITAYGIKSDVGPAVLTGDYTRPSPLVLGYVAQVAVLAKHMVAQSIPFVRLEGDMASQVVRQIRAEVFCRLEDDHWEFPGHNVIADCECFTERHSYCANLGRHLRQKEALRIIKNHWNIIAPYTGVPDQWVEEEAPYTFLIRERSHAADWFRRCRRGRHDEMTMARFDINPTEDQRYREAIHRLEATVLNCVELLRRRLTPEPPDEKKVALCDEKEEENVDNIVVERNLFARAVFLYKPLQWIAYDNGITDKLFHEISEMVIHWYLRVGTPLSESIDNAASLTAPGLFKFRRDIDRVRRDVEDATSRLDTVFSTTTWNSRRLFVRSFGESPARDEELGEVDACRSKRADLWAAAQTKLETAVCEADARIVTVQEARRLWPEQQQPPSPPHPLCPVCYSAFDDGVHARRPVLVCDANHVMSGVSEDDAPFLSSEDRSAEISAAAAVGVAEAEAGLASACPRTVKPPPSPYQEVTNLTVLLTTTSALASTPTCRAAAVKCPFIFDGRVPAIAKSTDFITALGDGWNPYNPDYGSVKGANLSSSDVVLRPRTPSPRAPPGPGSGPASTRQRRSVHSRS